MRVSILLVALALALCCFLVSGVKVSVDVELGHGEHHMRPAHHEHHAPEHHGEEPHHEVDEVGEVDEALPIVGSSRGPSDDVNVDDEVADDGTAKMRKPKTKFDPSLELPIVGAANEPVPADKAVINLAKASVLSALKKGAATRGITSTNFDLHLTRIVNQFNVVNMRLKLGRAVEVLAYVLATAEHETGRFKWLAEIGGPRKRYAPYYGRGYVQLTWKQNYARYDSKLHSVGLLGSSENIVKNPNFLSQNNQRARDCMAFIIIDGMITGAFGRPVINYINAKKLDYVNARRSVNILDKASTIAGYARSWATILKKAQAAK